MSSMDRNNVWFRAWAIDHVASRKFKKKIVKRMFYDVSLEAGDGSKWNYIVRGSDYRGEIEHYWLDFDVVLMQRVGLNDKSGTPAFLFDIVQMGPFLFTIEWDRSAAKFYLASTNKLDGMKYSLRNRLSKHDIVGNIFDNPDLLEVKR